METTTTEKPLVSYLKQKLIPHLLSQNGKVLGPSTGPLPEYSSYREAQRSATSLIHAPLLKTLSFVQYIPTISRKKYEDKVEEGSFRVFNPTRNSRSLFFASDLGVELIGYMIKGFYGAFPFVERRKVILTLRDRALSVYLDLPAEPGVTAPEWLVSKLDLFNNSNYHFVANTSPVMVTAPTGVEGKWVVRITCRTRNLREGSTTYSYTANHPANFGAITSGNILRQINNIHFSSSEALHLSTFIIEDLEKIFAFMKSLLEHIPCKKVL